MGYVWWKEGCGSARSPPSGPGHCFDRQAELRIAFWVGNISATQSPTVLVISN